MKPCKYEHEGRCCNAGCIYFRAECKKPCYALQPLTNFEKIKQMTIEEMADWLQDDISGCFCCIYGHDYTCPNTCIYGIKQWLESEAEE